MLSPAGELFRSAVACRKCTEAFHILRPSAEHNLVSSNVVVSPCAQSLCDAAFCMQMSLCACRHQLLLRPCSTAEPALQGSTSMPPGLVIKSDTSNMDIAIHICGVPACQTCPHLRFQLVPKVHALPVQGFCLSLKFGIICTAHKRSVLGCCKHSKGYLTEQ